MSGVKRVVLLMGQDIGYTRSVLRGVQAYSGKCPEWVFHDAPNDLRIIKPLSEWKPHGIIAHLFDLDLASRITEIGIPVVNVTSTLRELRIPLVDVDHIKVGQLAAQYFLDRGFVNFGYFGSSWTGFSVDREKGFREQLALRRLVVSSCYAEYLPQPPVSTSWTSVDRAVSRWLRQLPKPVAIFSSNDIPARALAEMCRQLGLKIPEEVALLGVDNDELECRLCRPRLSSVALPSEKIGFEAARLLHQLMQKRRLKCERIVLDPLHVVSRESTDTLAIDDRDVAAALAFIRNNAHKNIGAESILKVIPISRRALERKFREILGSTVLSEIRHARMDIVKSLLTETDLPMPGIAAQAGFSDARRMAVVFRQLTGITPREFRAKSRLEGVTQFGKQPD